MNMDIFLNALVAYFVVIDPLGLALIFNSLVQKHDPQHTRQIAFRATALSFVVIIGFGFFGASLLSRLGITLDAFRIAGGLLLFHTAFCMAVHPEAKIDPTDTATDIVVFPLTFPLLAGPGCLTLTILLFSRGSGAGGEVFTIILAVILILALTLAGLLLSKKLVQILGATAQSVIQRLLGVLLASLSVQFIADGILGFMAGMK